MLAKWIPNFEICEVGIWSRKIAKKTSLRTIAKFMFNGMVDYTLRVVGHVFWIIL